MKSRAAVGRELRCRAMPGARPRSPRAAGRAERAATSSRYAASITYNLTADTGIQASVVRGINWNLQGVTGGSADNGRAVGSVALGGILPGRRQERVSATDPRACGLATFSGIYRDLQVLPRPNAPRRAISPAANRPNAHDIRPALASAYSDESSDPATHLSHVSVCVNSVRGFLTGSGRIRPSAANSAFAMPRLA